MSIIYEALKKVEKLQSTASALPEANKQQKEKVKTNHFLLYSLYIAIAATGFFLASVVLGIFTKPLPTTPAPQPEQAALNPLPEPVSAPAAIQIAPVNIEQKQPPLELTLNGLFFSDDEGYVLINNQILREGDEINGVVVKRITLDGVELDAQGSTIKLPNK